MKTLLLPAFLIVALIGFAQPATAGPRTIDEGISYPENYAYESVGRNLIVRKVQLALEEDGYYVGDHSGQFGFETRAAVRRYRRDHGLPIVGKIDETFLRTLGFR
jgi:peptidoglycan hydrolase-like protein with peptidoglycan-binding domain